MDLSDSRLWTPSGYVFPPAAVCSGHTPQPGFPGSFADLSLRAALNHPECSGAPSSVCSSPLSGFAKSGWLTIHYLRNEAESDLLALRLAGSHFEASPYGLLRTALDSYMSNG